MSRTIRILLVDDHHIIRQGVRALLNAESDIEVVGQAGDGRAGVKLAAELVPDVVVMDVAMPSLNGLDATRQIHQLHPQTKVVALSACLSDETAAGLLAAGATALVPKDAAYEELVQAIRAVLAGKTYLSPGVCSGLVEQMLKTPGDGNGQLSGDSVFKVLSPREREVLQLMAEGRATKEIARDLDVSVKTVETHRRQLMEKLNMYSVAELTRYAVRSHLVQL
jgi:DNA-binding NarL/FixJ family response regulator